MIDISQHLVDKYVAFLDVLGFTELVNSNNEKTLSDYFNAIEQAKEIFRKEKSSLEVFAISDSIILTANNSPNDLKQLLTAIRSLHTYLVDKNIWLRGGLSFGEVAYIKEKAIIVGKGYIKAFKLEALAVVPRVIIDPSIINNSTSSLSEFIQNFNYEGNTELSIKLIHEYSEEKFRRTLDDAIFIDYVSRILVECYHSPQNCDRYTRLNTIFENIRSNLYSKQELYPKYLWVKKYFIEVLVDLERGARNNGPKNNESLYYEEWIERFLKM